MELQMKSDLSDGEASSNHAFGEGFTPEDETDGSEASNPDGQVGSASSSLSNGHSAIAVASSDASESCLPSNGAQVLNTTTHMSNSNPPVLLNTALTLKLMNQLNEHSKIAQQNLIDREKRCRGYERESNELREVICSMKHTVHILDNIRRVSRDYIDHMFELLKATLRQDNEQIEQINKEVNELESELRQWERKYHIMASFNASNETSNQFSVSFNGYNNTANQTPSSAASSEQCQENNFETCENLESADVDLSESTKHTQIASSSLTSPSASLSDSAACTNSSMMLIPPELCEMSMETHDGESMTLEDSNTSDHTPKSSQARTAAAAAAAAAAIMMNPLKRSARITASSPLIAAAVAAATAATATNKKPFGLNKGSSKPSGCHTSSNGNATSLGNSIHSGGGSHALTTHNKSNSTPSMYGNPTGLNKPLFRCDHDGCDYSTNMRQRLAMHKRAHAGEMLYTCDIPGCGYQSNYKGNIKIHKKHKHRLELGLSAEQTSNTTSTGKTNESITNNETRNVNKPKNSRGRKRKHSNASNPLVINVETLRHFVNLRHDATGGDGCQVSSCDLYSGNESGAKDLPLYECPVDGCNYRSKWKQCLTAHQFLHAGVKPFKCDFPGCNYRTNFKGNVNVHKRVHRTSEYKCKFPGCTFTTPWKNSFVIHQRNHLQSIGTENELPSSMSISISQPDMSTVSSALMKHRQTGQPLSKNIIVENSSSSWSLEKSNNSNIAKGANSTNSISNHIPLGMQSNILIGNNNNNNQQNALSQMDDEEDEDEEEEEEEEEEDEDEEEEIEGLESITFGNETSQHSISTEQDNRFGSDLMSHMVNDFTDYHNSVM